MIGQMRPFLLCRLRLSEFPHEIEASMNIVLTNDDGYDAPGLWAAHDALKSFGKVFIVAPRSERSASSHAITLRKPITVERIEDNRADHVFAVDGFPADCVRLAYSEIVGGPIGLVVSGINRGANAGVDTYYSGTVAAAREGAMLGLRAMAFSQAIRREVEVDWSLASRVTSKLIGELLEESLPATGIWSVNMPAPIPDDFENHIHRVPVATDPMPMSFEGDDTENGKVRSYRYGVPYWQRKVSTDSDYATIRDGAIAVTAIPVFGRF